MVESLDFGALAMVRDVTAGVASSNTRRTLVRRAAETLGQHLPLGSLELGWCDAGAASAAALVVEPGAEMREFDRALGGSGTLAILRGGRPQFEVGRPGEDNVVIPLLSPEGASGYARLCFTVTPDASLVSEAVLETLGRILAFAQHHCRLVERIAKLSSGAQHETQTLRQELLRYTEPDTLVARSESMRRVVESADLVAQHDTAVLLRGESGTGKELLARRIHRLSRRARQPFVSVNCGALPETLMESELFGHEKGAFTGAVGRYRGRFERANNGTIFLDEIAELPQSAQVKLLRVLQEGEFERLGGEETVRVNVRVLAATHRPLESMMERGEFRADLFYRINVFPIVIPPLRERREDIPVLAQRILAETSKRLGCRMPPLGPKGAAKLLDCPWEGNVRELANTLERAVIVSQGRELDFSELPSGSLSLPSRPEGFPQTFEDAARRTIRNALEACQGRVYGRQGAAARLGMPPSTLQGKMRRLGISRRDFRGGGGNSFR
jgi:transcriptional regulator with GAF, ATPase, and Fis domain